MERNKELSLDSFVLGCSNKHPNTLKDGTMFGEVVPYTLYLSILKRVPVHDRFHPGLPWSNRDLVPPTSFFRAFRHVGGPLGRPTSAGTRPSGTAGKDPPSENAGSPRSPCPKNLWFTCRVEPIAWRHVAESALAGPWQQLRPPERLAARVWDASGAFE